MRYGSVCSGIEAASVAWEPLGWEPAWFCEIDPFASALLAHRFPGVPNHGDFTKLLDPTHPVHAEPIDVLVGGTPCQDFSVAGLRAGIEGDRGSLTLDFCRLVGVLQPKWVVWENVPGVLSSDGGRAFGSFLGALAELGYGFAWRQLDAQYFGLAQRRKRVFVVGCAGAQSSRAGAVLLEPEGVRGDPPSRRKARKEAPADAGGRAAEPGGVVVAPPLTATNDPSRSPQSAEVTAQVASVVEAMAFNGYARTVGEVATPLMAEDYKKVEIGVLVPGVMAFDYKQSGGDAVFDMTPTLRATPHANTWANGGGHVGIVNVEHGLHSSGNLDIREVSEPITASEYKGHSVVLQGGNAPGGKPSDTVTLTASASKVGDAAPHVATLAQYFGVPQRRRRVFVVGHLGDWGRAAAVLFEREGVCGSAKKGRDEVPSPPSSGSPCGDLAFNWQEPRCFKAGPLANPLQVQQKEAVLTVALRGREGGSVAELGGTVATALRASQGGGDKPYVLTDRVRRLTPVECERLQGFPDDWTLIPYRKGQSSDSNRYRALGNSMAVPCMFWIGARIAQRIKSSIDTLADTPHGAC